MGLVADPCIEIGLLSHEVAAVREQIDLVLNEDAPLHDVVLYRGSALAFDRLDVGVVLELLTKWPSFDRDVEAAHIHCVELLGELQVCVVVWCSVCVQFARDQVSFERPLLVDCVCGFLGFGAYSE